MGTNIKILASIEMLVYGYQTHPQGMPFLNRTLIYLNIIFFFFNLVLAEQVLSSVHADQVSFSEEGFSNFGKVCEDARNGHEEWGVECQLGRKTSGPIHRPCFVWYYKWG